MPRHKKLSGKHVTAKMKWKEEHRAFPRKAYSKQKKDFRRKTGQTVDYYIPEDIPKKKYKVGNGWTTEYNSGPVVPDAPLDIPWHTKVEAEDGRKKDIKEKKRLRKLGAELPDFKVLKSSSEWWNDLPYVVSIE